MKQEKKEKVNIALLILAALVILGFVSVIIYNSAPSFQSARYQTLKYKVAYYLETRTQIEASRPIVLTDSEAR